MESCEPSDQSRAPVRRVPAASAVGSTGEPGRAGEDAHSAIWAGSPAGNATLSLPIFDTVINGKTVIGSIVGTRNDLAPQAAGRTTVIAVDRKIDEINQSIDDVLAGTVPARVVFQF